MDGFSHTATGLALCVQTGCRKIHMVRHACDLLVCELILALSGRISNNHVSSYIYAAIVLDYYILCKSLINKSQHMARSVNIKHSVNGTSSQD